MTSLTRLRLIQFRAGYNLTLLDLSQAFIGESQRLQVAQWSGLDEEVR